MFSRPTTLIYVGRERLARCDVDARRGEAVGFWSRARPMAAEVPTLVDTALRLGKSRPSRVWVLSDDFWTHKLTLNPDAVEGLSPAEVSRVLAFEAEGLSGVSAVDSEVGVTELRTTDGRRDYWLIQVPRWVRDQVDQSVRAAGGKLLGMIHPGGLPHALSDTNEAQGWCRVETWPGIVMAVGARTGGAVERSVFNADGRNAATTRGLAEWREALGDVSVEQLVDGKRTPLLGDEAAVLRLDDEATLTRWLVHWAATLDRRELSVPSLSAPARPVTDGHRAAMALGLAAMVAGIAVWDSSRINARIGSLDKEQKRLKRETTAWEQSQLRITKLEKDLTGAKTALNRLTTETASTETSLRAYRQRWAELLAAIESSCPRDVLVREISHRGRIPMIQGVSLGVAPVTEFASRLAESLGNNGWNVSPSYKSVEGESGAAKLYEFSLLLNDVPVSADLRAVVEK